MTQSLALSTPSHLDRQQHIQPIPRPESSTEIMSMPRILSSTIPTHDSMYIRKRMNPRATSNGSKRNPKAKKPGASRSPPSHPNISSANKNVRTNSPTTHMIHSKSTENTAITKDSATPHKASKKTEDPPVIAASDSNNHANVTESPSINFAPPVQEPPTDPKIIVLAIVGSLVGLACCFCCLLGVSRIGCCFLHRFAVGQKNNDVVFETVSVGGKKIGPPMPIEDTDEEESRDQGTTTTTDRSKPGRSPFTEFWNISETRKDTKRSSKGQNTKGRGSLNGSGNVKAATTAHHITSPIESLPPQRYDRANSPTIYYNPEFAFSNMNGTGVKLPQSPPAVVLAQASTDPLKSKRMPSSSPQPKSKASESFLSNPSSISVFRLSDHDTHEQQSQKRPGPKPLPINTSLTWQDLSASSSSHKSPTTPFPGNGRVGGDEGYFSANPHIALSPVIPSPVYPPYPQGAAYHFTHQQQPVGFDQAQHQHRIQTPYQSQSRSEYGNQGHYY